MEHANKRCAALIVDWRRREVWIACVNGGATRQQSVSQCWSAVILEWAEQGIGVDLVAGAGQETAAIVTAKIVAVRSNGTV